MILFPPAKINLCLDVLGRRPDGYHEVRMIMQTISLRDELSLEVTREPGITLEVEGASLPGGPTNLAYRGAALLMEEFGIHEGLSMRLRKNIPMEAGMGGGSADAAAALLGTARLFSLPLSMEDLRARAVRLGADVPYCLMGGTALAEGVGEKLTPLPDLAPLGVLIAKPEASVSTKEAYQGLNAPLLSEPGRYMPLEEGAASLRKSRKTDAAHPDVDGMLAAIQKGDMEGVIARTGNSFEKSIIARHPVIQEIKERMKADGARTSCMTGSGPTVFGLFDDDETLSKAASSMKRSGLAAFVCAGKLAPASWAQA